MNDIKVFENDAFGSVRTIDREGDVWFVGKDVAAALGYSNTNDALSRHVDPEDKYQGEGGRVSRPPWNTSISNNYQRVWLI